MPFESTGEWESWLNKEEALELCLLDLEISLADNARAQRQKLRKRASKRMEKARSEAKEETNAKGRDS